MSVNNYLDINRKSWNDRVALHVNSEFYNQAAFMDGATSLQSIELAMLGDISGKSVLHLQCHFGQDTLSLARMGAKVCGVDLSDEAIEQANQLSRALSIDARFICSDVYDLPNHLDEQFDIVFTSYGVIGWLPDLDKWAKVIQHFLKPGGRLVFVEFHPVVWMFDDAFDTIAYSYFNKAPIIETQSGTYADKEAPVQLDYVSWNHSLSEVLQSLFSVGLQLTHFEERDYSPYNCFDKTIEFEPGKFRIQHLQEKIPMLYALMAVKH